MLGAKAEAEAKAKSILDGKAASARLDCAKIELAEKRGVLDSVYEKALKKLKELDKKTAVALAGGLLAKYAEDGDEIVFAADYKFVSEVAKLPVVTELKLKFSGRRSKRRIYIKGRKRGQGYFLRGVACGGQGRKRFRARGGYICRLIWQGTLYILTA